MTRVMERHLKEVVRNVVFNRNMFNTLSKKNWPGGSVHFL